MAPLIEAYNAEPVGSIKPRILGAIVLFALPKLVPACATGLLMKGNNSFDVKLQYCAASIDSIFATNKGKNWLVFVIVPTFTR